MKKTNQKKILCYVIVERKIVYNLLHHISSTSASYFSHLAFLGVVDRLDAPLGLEEPSLELLGDSR